MSAAQLSEKTRNLIITQIQNNIVAELAAVSTDRNDFKVNLPAPKEYFIFPLAHTYQCPAIFVHVDSAEISDARDNQNYLGSEMKVFVSAVVEDREADLLTIKCDRYQAALLKILHWQMLSDTNVNFKMWVHVVRLQFSEMFTKSRKSEGLADFRKEVVLEVTAKVFENPTS